MEPSILDALPLVCGSRPALAFPAELAYIVAVHLGGEGFSLWPTSTSASFAKFDSDCQTLSDAEPGLVIGGRLADDAGELSASAGETQSIADPVVATARSNCLSICSRYLAMA